MSIAIPRGREKKIKNEEEEPKQDLKDLQSPCFCKKKKKKNKQKKKEPPKKLNFVESSELMPK